MKSFNLNLFLVSGLLVIVIIYSINQYSPHEEPIEEIKDFQGIKLGSYTDFEENSIKGPQSIEINSYRLKVTGLVETELEYKYDEVLGFPSQEKVIQLDCVEGWSVRVLWEGVLLEDLIDEASVKPEAVVVIFRAVDGYSTSLPLSYIIEEEIILAYKINNITLPEANGYPFQVVAESKWGYKWCKWVSEIELSDDLDFRGTWESAGFSNKAESGGQKWETRN
ncbi:molybdopterin-dependent oxidoreductase [Candidatus Bathyarchaeota archaeon]|nr:molybdopterin-dependent oxidoreductase [Candidatus Bathyarchaeota archaeon]